MGKERSRGEVYSRLCREFIEKLHVALDPYANKGLFWALGTLLYFQYLTYARIATIEETLKRRLEIGIGPDTCAKYEEKFLQSRIKMVEERIPPQSGKGWDNLSPEEQKRLFGRMFPRGG